MNGDFEGFGRVPLHVDLDDLPSFSFTLDEGALLGNGLVTVHVKIDLFRGWIAVVTKDYLLGGPHMLSPFEAAAIGEPRWMTTDESIAEQWREVAEWPNFSFLPMMVTLQRRLF